MPAPRTIPKALTNVLLQPQVWAWLQGQKRDGESNSKVINRILAGNMIADHLNRAVEKKKIG